MEWPKSCLETTTDSQGKIIAKDVASISCIPTLFTLAINVLFGFAALIALFFVFIAGFKFLTSGGDEKKIEEARKTLTFAIIGLVLIILAIPILNLIVATIDPALGSCLLNFGFLCK